MCPYRYHELRPLTTYFPCHWVVPVMSYEDSKDFLSNKCLTRFLHFYYAINSDTISHIRIQQNDYCLHCHFLDDMLKFSERYSNVSKFRMTFKSVYLSLFNLHLLMWLIFYQYLTLPPPKKSRFLQESHKNSISSVCLFSQLNIYQFTQEFRKFLAKIMYYKYNFKLRPWCSHDWAKDTVQQYAPNNCQS